VPEKKKPKDRGKPIDQTSKSGLRQFEPLNSAGGVQSALMAHAGMRSDTGRLDFLASAQKSYERGDYVAAEQGCLAIIKKAPKNYHALTLYGIILLAREKYEKSSRILKKSIALDANQTAAYNALGSVYRVLGDFDESIKAFETALALEPGRAEILNNIGVAYREWGSFEQAADYYERALEINPSLAEAWNGLVRTQRFTKLPERLGDLNRSVATTAMAKESKRHAFFALGKIYDDLGNYAEAFKCYQQSNALRDVPADANNACLMMSKIRDTFSSDRIASFPLTAPKRGDARPIFILGMPRSGTTLVEQILSSHPGVAWGGELNFFTETTRNLKRKTIFGDQKFPESMTDITCEELTKIRTDFLKVFKRQQKTRSSNVLAVTDKTPFNFLYVGLISLALPDAIILHCRRNPLDTCLSIFFTDFSKTQPFTTDLKEIGKYFNCYERLMAHWRDVPTAPILDVNYESLVLHQEEESRKIIEFCGLEWDERCLAFHENRRLVSTPSDWQVRQPIYDQSIGRWRNYEAHLEPLFNELDV